MRTCTSRPLRAVTLGYILRVFARIVIDCGRILESEIWLRRLTSSISVSRIFVSEYQKSRIVVVFIIVVVAAVVYFVFVREDTLNGSAGHACMLSISSFHSRPECFRQLQTASHHAELYHLWLRRWHTGCANHWQVPLHFIHWFLNERCGFHLFIANSRNIF